ncbi:hypothetical protein CVT26_002931 [Gymnopilus dilepis]|uniref:GTP-binding protein n=1 Tax=Gymnopilus dilepis TaxID=231916 RepID=A0A409VQY0_9AGAR|nr:hypothetical protein CVT26_002931 [Gymnopilus dilepis]
MHSSSVPPKHSANGHGTRSPNGSIPRTKILLLGLRRAGKTSIQQVLFNNLPPNQTFYLETTMRIVKHQIESVSSVLLFVSHLLTVCVSWISTVIPLEIWDCPANTTVESLGVPLSQFSTIIFVIDIRDLYNQPISKLVEFIVASYAQNPDIILEVFVHKAEKLQEDDKIENFRQIHERVSDRLLDMSPEYEQMQLNFHLTSVYDHSLHEAFSRVLHKLIESLPFLEELLNVFCANCQSPKAFLFDIRSRLYVATDASPVDSATHNLCCDYLQMLNSFGPLYRSITASPNRQRQLTGEPLPATPPPTTTTSTTPASGSRSPRPTSPSSTSATSPPLSPGRPPNTRLNTISSNGNGSSSSASSGLLSPTSPGASSPAAGTTPRPANANGFRAHAPTGAPAAAGNGHSAVRPPPVPHPPSSTTTTTGRGSTLSPSGSTSNTASLVGAASSTSSVSASASASGSTSSFSASASQLQSPSPLSPSPGPTATSKPKPKPALFYPSASTTLSSTTTLSHSHAHSHAHTTSTLPPSLSLANSPAPSPGTTTLTYHLITPHLALLALVPTHVYEERRGLVEYNVVFFREGVQEIMWVEEEGRGG